MERKILCFVLSFVWLCLLSIFAPFDSRKHLNQLKLLEKATNINNSRKIKVLDASLEEQFEEYNNLRKVRHSIAYVSAAPKDLKFKVSYLESALRFMKDRIEKVPFISNRQLDDFVFLTNLLRKTRDDLKIYNEQQLDSFLEKLGKWFSLVRKDYLERTKSYHDNCKKRMKNEERKIAELIFDTQQGTICQKATDVLYYYKEFQQGGLGIGSLLHRMSHCFATAISTGKPCLIDDTSFEYDPRNLSLYLKSAMKICPKAKKVSKFSYKIDQSPQIFRDFSLPRVPLHVKDNLQYCVEDVLAWYSGVVLKHGLQISDYIKKSVKNVKKMKKMDKHFAAVHIRSTDKGSEAEILPASSYFRYLETICVLYGNELKSCKKGVNCWIATDSYHNVAEFKKTMSLHGRKDIQLSTLSENSFNNQNYSRFRYIRSSAIQFFQDLNMMVDSELTIGTYTSNTLMYALEVKSVNNQFPSDSTFSLDAMLYNTIPSMTPHAYYVIDCNYVIPAEEDLFFWKLEEYRMWSTDFCSQRNWKADLDINRVFLVSAWQNNRNGFVLVFYNEAANFTGRRFLVPVYNIQKKIQTIDKLNEKS